MNGILSVVTRGRRASVSAVPQPMKATAPSETNWLYSCSA